MKTVLVTGSRGFIGKHLLEALSKQDGVRTVTFGSDEDQSVLKSLLNEVDIIFHLAGVNRPLRVEEFAAGNTAFTETIVSMLAAQDRKPAIVMSSSTQAALDNPYGVSKKKAEDVLIDYGKRTGARVSIYRFTNVFGKWCRPNYNSVVATFCHNIARGLDITISDRNKVLELVYIDDVIKSFLHILHDEEKTASPYLTIERTYKTTLGDLADAIYKLRDAQDTLNAGDIADDFMKYLYVTYRSYLANELKLP